MVCPGEYATMIRSKDHSFDMRKTLVRVAAAEGLRATARKHRIFRNTVRQWTRRFKRLKFDGLRTRIPPHPQTAQKTPAQERPPPGQETSGALPAPADRHQAPQGPALLPPSGQTVAPAALPVHRPRRTQRRNVAHLRHRVRRDLRRADHPQTAPPPQRQRRQPQAYRGQVRQRHSGAAFRGQFTNGASFSLHSWFSTRPWWW